MDLKELSETISCNHIMFLNKKYDVCNNELFKKQMKCNYDLDYNRNRFAGLKSINITKKSCFFKPPTIYNNMTTTIDNNDIMNINNKNNVDIMFNVNTRIKTSRE